MCGGGGGGRERERLFKKRFSCSHTDVIIYEELYEHEQHSKRSIVSQTPVQTHTQWTETHASDRCSLFSAYSKQCMPRSHELAQNVLFSLEEEEEDQ